MNIMTMPMSFVLNPKPYSPQMTRPTRNHGLRNKTNDTVSILYFKVYTNVPTRTKLVHLLFTGRIMVNGAVSRTATPADSHDIAVLVFRVFSILSFPNSDSPLARETSSSFFARKGVQSCGRGYRGRDSGEGGRALMTLWGQ